MGFIIESQRQKPQIGILGGVFDPVHCGHLAVAMLAKESFGLDEVIFIPSGVPPHKSTVIAPSDDRLNMLNLALKGLDGCSVWDGEIKRDGYSYTIDTLTELCGVYGVDKFYFIIGTDNLPEIRKWRSFEKIIEKVILCAAKRPGYGMDIPDALASADIRDFPGPEWGNSSTLIRDYLKKGHSCRFLLPDTVIEYIREKGLYGYNNR